MKASKSQSFPRMLLMLMENNFSSGFRLFFTLVGGEGVEDGIVDIGDEVMWALPKGSGLV